MIVEPLTLGQMLSAQARLQPDKIAARDFSRSMTYRQWHARANRLANGLLGLGLSKGDRVAVLAYNRVEWVEIYAACALANLIAVPINFRLTSPEITYILQHSEASVLLAEDALLEVAQPAAFECGISESRQLVITDGQPLSGLHSYQSLLQKANDSDCTSTVVADDPWCIMYTSGTTGRPKGAVRSHRGMSMLALMTAIELKLHRRDDALLVMPMCHANSLNFFTAFTHCGGTITIYSQRSFDPALCLQTFANTGATFTSLVPTHYSMMLECERPDQSGHTYERVEKLMISSAPARPDTKHAIMEMFPNSGLYELYGSTEAGWVTMLHPHEQFDKLGTVGREVVGSLPIKLIDDDGNEVPDGEAGELYSCGPYCFDQYWRQPDATAEAFRGQYLTVGDVAKRDSTGYIQLIDRKKNIIISGGENIYPSEVENVIGSHPQVSDVAVIGKPDNKWGERVTAAVVVKKGSNVSSEELQQLAQQQLAGFKRPREIVFLAADDMPRNATGKILHRQLRQLLLEKDASSEHNAGSN